jgi:hypothetical protein
VRAEAAAVEVRERRRAGRAQVARGVVLVALSPLVFQLAGPLAHVVGRIAAAAVSAVVGFVLARAGAKRVVLGTFAVYDAKRAPSRSELPEARALPPRQPDAE